MRVGADRIEAIYNLHFHPGRQLRQGAKVW